MTNENSPWLFPVFGAIIVGLFIFAMINLWIDETKK